MNAAHFHLIINHVPVLGSLFVCVLLVFTLATGRRPETIRFTLWVTIILAVLTWPVYLSGEPAEEVIEQYLDPPAKQLLHEHEEMAERAIIPLQIAALLALIALVGLYRRGQVSRGFLYALLVVNLVGLGMVGYTANLGGKISHAEMR